MATHSSILAWRIPWSEEPGGLQPMGQNELDMTEQLHLLKQKSRTQAEQTLLSAFTVSVGCVCLTSG